MSEKLTWPGRGGQLDDRLLEVIDNSRVAELRFRFESPLDIIGFNTDMLSKDISIPPNVIVEVQKILTAWEGSMQNRIST